MAIFHFHLGSSISGRVDKEAGVIRGVAVITGGVTAKGHNLVVDEKTLEQVAACGRAKGRVQVKLNHRDPQALQSICGFLEGFRKEGNKVVADWHLLKSHDEFARIIERAERMPECFGLSAAFAGPEKGERGKDGKNYARCEELVAVDCVTAPAANPSGLFERGGATRGSATLRAIADRAKRLARKVEFAEKKRELPPELKAAASGAVSGALLGGLPAFRRGTKLTTVSKSVAKGAAGAAALVGGGTFVGSKILGKPNEGEGAPYTKRAALGGALVGSAAGAVGGVAALRTRVGRRFLVRASKNWRPAVWARRSGTAGAAALGGVAGAAIGGAHAADEGQQVDSIEALRKDRRKQAFSEFVDPRPRDNFGQFTPAAAGGQDPNSMARAYGGVSEEKARRLAPSKSDGGPAEGIGYP